MIEIVESVIVCGDGILDVSESCDDGNTLNGDGCDAMCNTEIETVEIDAIMKKKQALPTYNPLPLPEVIAPAILPET